MRVVAVEDHRLVYDALEAVVRLIEPDCDLRFAATLADGLRLLTQTIQTDLVLMDLGLPDSRGLATLASFRQSFPELPVVVISGLDESDPAFHDVVFDAINEHRAMGFIPKSHDKDRSIMALRHVLAGNIYLPREAAHSSTDVVRESSDRMEAPIVVHPSTASSSLRTLGLTEAQSRVARLLLQGLSNKEIARTLAITDHTVKAHARSIFDTLSVKNRLQAVIKLERLLWDARIDPAQAE